MEDATTSASNATNNASLKVPIVISFLGGAPSSSPSVMDGPGGGGGGGGGGGEVGGGSAATSATLFRAMDQREREKEMMRMTRELADAQV